MTTVSLADTLRGHRLVELVVRPVERRVVRQQAGQRDEERMVLQQAEQSARPQQTRF